MATLVLEQVAKTYGSVAVLRYDVVVALFVRGANSGADLITLGAVVVACVAAVVAMIGPWGRQMAERQLKLSRTRSAAKKTVEPG